MARGRYNTAHREMVTRCLESLGDHHATASDVFDRLRADGADVSRATVYRQIEHLVEEGSVIRFTPEGERRACLQLVRTEGCRGEHCYHLKCTECGRLIHLDCDEVKPLLEHLEREHGFTVDVHRTVLMGVCRDCRKER